MAGFDFHVPVQLWERPFAAVLLRELQRMASMRLCDRPTVVRFNWRFPRKSHNYHRYIVSIDGDFAEVQAFAFDALYSLQHFSRGYRVGQPEFRKSYLPAIVPISFIKRISEISDGFHNLEAQVSAMHPGVKLQTNNYMFRQTGCSDVDRVLAATRNILLQWRSGFIAGPTLAEQMHTACEVSLKAALGTPSSVDAFAVHVVEASRRGIIDSNQKEALIELKNARRNIKHQGQGINPERLLKLVQGSVGALHALASACSVVSGSELNKSVKN